MDTMIPRVFHGMQRFTIWHVRHLPFVLITSGTRNLADFTILQLVLLNYCRYIVEYTAGPDCPGDMHMTIFVLFHAVDVCDLITSSSIACC